MPQSEDRAARQWVLGITAVSAFMVALDALVVTAALATMRSDFGVSLETLQWVTNAYNLSFAVLLLTGAALGDRFGRRRMFVAGLVLFVLASIGCALAGSIGLLIVARVAQGAGAALVVPIAMTLLSAAFPPAGRARALGVFSGVVGCALITGPAAGGAITAAFGWHWIFWINVPIGLIVVPLALRRIDESFGPSARLDLVGMLLVAAAAFALVWGLLRAGAAGWNSLEVTGLLAAAVLLFAAFVGWELRTEAPMVPMRMFRAPAFASGIAASLFFYAAMYGVLFLLPQFLQTSLGYGALGSGLGLLPWTATLFVTAPIAGSLVNRIGERTIVVFGLLLQAGGMAWIALIATPGVAYAQLVVPLIVAGTGVSMAMPAVQNAILGSVAVVEMGKASGVFNMVRFLGGMFGVALLVATVSVAAPSAAGVGAGFAAAMAAAAALSLGGAIAGFWLPARRQSATIEAKA